MAQTKPRIDVRDIFPELYTQVSNSLQMSGEEQVCEEIEVKIKLDGAQYATFLAWLEQNGQKEKEVHQKDVYYDKLDPKESFFFLRYDGSSSYIDALRSVRIRYTRNKIIVNTKLRSINKSSEIVGCEEFEQPKTWEEIETFQKLLAKNEYIEKLIVEKDRTIYNVNHQDVDIEVALDKVMGLDGVFVELELKKTNISNNQGKKLLYDLLFVLGIQTFTQYKRGYIVILTNPEYNFEERVTLERKKT
ncbi:MAG: CYTH domain-containing protein [bacterium]